MVRERFKLGVDGWDGEFNVTIRSTDKQLTVAVESRGTHGYDVLDEVHPDSVWGGRRVSLENIEAVYDLIDRYEMLQAAIIKCYNNAHPMTFEDLAGSLEDLKSKEFKKIG